MYISIRSSDVYVIGIYQDELLAQNTLDAFSNILRQLQNTDIDKNAQAEAEARCNATHFDELQNLTAKTVCDIS